MRPLWALLVFALLSPSACRKAQPDKTLLNLFQEGALLVDVRTRAEVRRSPVPGAKHIPLQEIPRRSGEIPRDRAVIFFCHSGVRSARAVRHVRKKGWKRVYNGGGYKAWKTQVRLRLSPGKRK